MNMCRTVFLNFQIFKFSKQFIFKFIFPALLCLNFCTAQSQKQYLKYGDKAFSESNVYGAAYYYHKAMTLDSTKLDIVYKYAESLRMYNEYGLSAKYYEYVFKRDMKLKFRESLFWQATMQKSNGHYTEAKKNFKKVYSFIYKKEPTSYFYLKSLKEQESCDFAINNSKTDTSKISIKNLGHPVNTINSEFSALPINDTVLYFSSLRTSLPKENSEIEDAEYWVRIYQNNFHIDTLNPPKEIDNLINTVGFHNANGSFSNDGQRFYFSRCDKNFNCAIYWSEKKNNIFQKSIRLNEQINLSGSTNTQPFIANYDDKEILFFVSNRQGGQGKLDIWYSIISDKKKYSSPLPLHNKINSLDDEISPFYDSKNKILYFSSAWHNGFGGFDIFKSEGTIDDFKAPENLGRPINSSANDFYFILNSDTNGYLTSNRIGSITNKGETCCNDIFAFKLPEIKKKSKEIVRFKDVESAAESSVSKEINEKYLSSEIRKEKENLNLDKKIIVSTKPSATLNSTAVVTNTEIIKSDTIQKNKTEIVTNNSSEMINSTAIVVNSEIKKDTNENFKLQTSNFKLQTFLPLMLYFHNDEPNPKTLDTTTKVNYINSYKNYFAMKEIYKNEYNAGLTREQEEYAENNVEQFFNKKVKKGADDLDLFSKELLSTLLQNQEVQLKIKGYASPLAKNNYNINLSKRRINSLINYLKEFDNGIFIKFITNSSLSFIYEPFGEEEANKTISDNLNDKRNSVYNPEAAMERKIEIIMALIKPEIRNQKSEILTEKPLSDMVFEETTYDFGAINYGEKVEHIFKYKNVGSTDLIIYNAVGSCGCTVAEFPKEPIPSGKSAEIKIIFDSTGKFGKQNKTVTITTNTFPNTRTLSISGDVVIKNASPQPSPKERE